MNYVVAFFLGFFLIGCGGGSYEETREPTPGPTPRPGGVTPAQQAAWDGSVKRIVTTKCVRCHSSDGFVKTPAAFLKSRSKAMVASGAMPKGGLLSAADKAAIAGL